MSNIDFEGGNNITSNADDKPQNPTPTNNEDQVDITTGKTDDINDQTKQVEDPKPTDSTPEKTEENSLEEGTIIELDGVEYSINANGELIDSKGNVVKSKDEVKQLLDDNNVQENDDNSITISNLQKELGEIYDDKGNPIKYEDSVKGVKEFLTAYKDIQLKEAKEGVINKFYNDNPLIKQFIDYVELTGSAKGFGDIPDRRGIKIDAENKEQQKAIIRMAASEFGNATLNENYIKYLESTGDLYNEAKVQLKALQDKDIEVRNNIAKQAEEARQAEEIERNNYFAKVNQMITGRKIGNYTLPENIVKTINGRKVTLGLNDFYRYVAAATESDEQGNVFTAYQRDLHNQTDDELLSKELIDAWLMFTDGSYNDLINMIAKEEQVKKLVIKSKENRNKHQVAIKKPTKSKNIIDDIIF